MVPGTLVCKTVWSHEKKIFWRKTTHTKTF